MCCAILYAIYTAQLISSPVEGHLEYFPFFTTRNNAALKISEHGSLLTSLGCKYHTVGYDNPNYPAQVFCESVLQKAALSIHPQAHTHLALSYLTTAANLMEVIWYLIAVQWPCGAGQPRKEAAWIAFPERTCLRAQ